MVPPGSSPAPACVAVRPGAGGPSGHGDYGVLLSPHSSGAAGWRGSLPNASHLPRCHTRAEAAPGPRPPAQEAVGVGGD